MLVIDKPAGLAVHRGPKGGASLEDYFDALRYGLPRAPALAHRLDKETSGCLVLGRHRKALAHLGLLFKHGKVGKTYWAVVEGGPDAAAGTIEVMGRGTLADVPRVGPERATHRSEEEVGPSPPVTWLALEPVTGRTHQLRVHCAAMGWPIAGDNIYGTAPRFGGPGLHLHAREVAVPISKNRQPVRVIAPLPAHMHALFSTCGWSGERDQ
jgi:tRNA pseudouridine32 synthase/23S rRNA pseudouridine746 synthase